MSRLLEASRKALQQMLKVPATREFTDAIDELDLAISTYEQDIDRVDALRWRGIMACQRVRVLGWAGLKGSTISKPNEPYAHIGLELWTLHDHGEDNPYGCGKLTEFADKARRVCLPPPVDLRSIIHDHAGAGTWGGKPFQRNGVWIVACQSPGCMATKWADVLEMRGAAR